MQKLAGISPCVVPFRLNEATAEMPLAEPTLSEAQAPYSEASWALLERMVASPQLKRAARLREFLLFVGRRALKQDCGQVHEQEIGCEVFGRPPGYDTSTDNIVRVNASELRKRIEDYFESDGKAETLILEIPRGSYKPVFRQRAAKAEPVAEEPDFALKEKAEAGAAVKPRPMLYARLLAASGVAILALSVACGGLWTENRAMRRSMYAWKSTPALNSFWSGFLDSRQNTDLILADTSFALIEDITRKPVSLDEYLSRNYVARVASPDLSQDRQNDLRMISQRNNGSLGDFRGAQRIIDLDPLGKSVHLYSARDYTPALVKQDNVILIGARKSNPWVDLFAGSMNFTADSDPKRLKDFIVNHAPLPGEAAIYETPEDQQSTGYAVVAYLPNPQHGGNVLILAGLGSQDTEGAGEFITSEDQLSNFKKLLRVTSLPYFEVLLKTTHLNSTPISTKVVAYRTYPGSH